MNGSDRYRERLVIKVASAFCIFIAILFALLFIMSIIYLC